MSFVLEDSPVLLKFQIKLDIFSNEKAFVMQTKGDYILKYLPAAMMWKTQGVFCSPTLL